MSELTETQIALDNFVTRALSQRDLGCFTQSHDPEWLSPCEQKVENGTSFWKPQRQTENLDFSGLANAVESPIHVDIQEYYSFFWSGTLLGKTSEGPLSLIQVWNTEDFTRLLENLIGHLFNKIRSKSPFTVFIANTEEDSELFLSVDNETGVVLLEDPSSGPIREVAANLHSFLDRIEPDTREAEIY